MILEEQTDHPATSPLLPSIERLHVALLESLRKRASGVDGTGETFERSSPLCYPGLRSFEPDEGTLFFGRDTSLTEVQEQLAAERTLVVLGGSGSGKSSLIRAGILPFLNSRRKISNRAGIWFWAEFRPRTEPFGELGAALRQMIDKQVEGDNEPLREQAILLASQIGSAGPVVSDRLAAAEQLTDQLLDFVRILDEIDAAEHGTLRSGPVNIMLLLDQFEEVFRPDVAPEVRERLLDLIVVVHGRIEASALTKDQKPGLFLVITMRSEELHRCAEHAPLSEGLGTDVARSLTDVVNASFYLLRLLDPHEDRLSLREAILRPVRAVMRAYELPSPADDDYPYAPGVIDWLLRGVAEVGVGEHQPDQMPLLQHALRQMWLNAVTEWPVTCRDVGTTPLIEKRHLFATGDRPPDDKVDGDNANESKRADVKTCLQRTADRTAEMAALRAVPDGWGNLSDEARQSLREAVPKAIFRALARVDDRNNWARRFGTLTHMDRFLARDSKAAAFHTAEARRAAISAALVEFLAEGLVQESEVRGEPNAPELQYDISHESLIRNWKRCQSWLEKLVLVTNQLSRAITDLSPEARGNRSAEYLVSERLADDLAPLADATPAAEDRLPQEWAWGELQPRLAATETRHRWKLVPGREPISKEAAQSVLDDILGVRRDAIEQRLRKRFIRNGALAAATMLLIVAVFAGGMWKQQIAQTHQAESAQQEAEESRTLAEDAQAKEKIAHRATARAAAETGLMDHTSLLPPIPGDRPKFGLTAVSLRYAEAMLNMKDDNRTDAYDINPNRVEPRIWGAWDRTLRQILGLYLLDEADLKSVPAPKYLKAHCLTIGAVRPGKSTAAILAIRPDESLSVRLVQKEGNATQGSLLVDAEVDGNSSLVDPAVFEQSVDPGDEVCLSDDARMVAWRTRKAPYTISSAELDWVTYKGKLYPHGLFLQVKQEQMDSAKAELACIRGFYYAQDAVAQLQGIETSVLKVEDYPVGSVEESKLAMVRLEDLCRQQRDQNDPPRGKGDPTYVHFTGLFSPSHIPSPAVTDSVCTQDATPDLTNWDEISPKRTWSCGENLTVGLGPPTKNTKNLSTTLLSVRQIDRFAITVPVPQRAPEDIIKVSQAGGRLVLTSAGNIDFALIYRVDALDKLLQAIKTPATTPAKQELTAACAGYLPQCEVQIKQNWANNGDWKYSPDQGGPKK